MEPYQEQINALLPVHREVAGFNPALRKLYPVALVADGQFHVYDYSSDQARYRFIKHAALPMPIPAGVRAAFQLADYGGRIACVVTPEVFDRLEGYVTILHEFVHCYQYETCEQALKSQLDVARLAQEKGDFMWEIEYPFPYQAGAFTRAYTAFLDAVSRRDQADIFQARIELHTYLGLHDYEYMVWQEWKEGFARWVENRLQQALGLQVNQAGLDPPFSRVTFYAGGAALIDHLSARDPAVVADLEALFHQISQPLVLN